MAHIPERSDHCAVDDLAAFLDGELADDRRRSIEAHVSGCSECHRELNFQKKMLLALDGPFADADLELPKDFTKRVITAAESRVDGLRRPRELRNAIVICSALLFFSVFMLGADAGRAFAVVGAAFDVASAVAGTVGHFALDMALAAAVILKTLVLIGFSGSAGPAVFAAALILGSVILFSRFLLRQGRA